MRLFIAAAASAFVLTMAGCVPPPPPSLSPKAVPPPISGSEPGHLEEAMIARIEIAREVSRGIARRWGLRTTDLPCTVVHDGTQAWMFDCGIGAWQTQPGFTVTKQTVDGEKVVWAHGRDLELFGVRISADTNPITIHGVEGSHAYDVVIVPDWPRFAVAWQELQPSTELWVAMLVHETFHAQQRAEPLVRATMATIESRSRLVEQRDLADFWESNADYRDAVAAEILVLDRAVEDPSSDATAALRTWLALYERRRLAFEPAMLARWKGADGWQADGIFTFFEGLARYVEVDFLQHLPPALATRSAGRSPKDIYRWAEPSRGYVYSIGLHLAFLLDRVSTTWRHDVLTNEGLLVGAVAGIVERTR